MSDGQNTNRAKTVARNILSNWTGYAVNALVTLLLTPYVLQQLGDTRYGIWVLTFSVIGYYGMLDLGFRAGVNQYITRYINLGDYQRVNECASTAFFALSGLGAVISLLSLAAAFLAPKMFHMPPELYRESFWCILLIGNAAGVQCAFFPFSAVFTATQRYDLANAIGISSRILSAISIWMALRAGTGLLGLSLVACTITVLDYVVRWRVACRLVPEMAISRKLLNPARLREITSFGLWNFLISISTYLSVHADSLVVGSMISVAAVAHYALATGLFRQIVEMVLPISQVFYPVAVQLHVQGNQEDLERVFVSGSRLLLTVVICAASVAWVWAGDFYQLWVSHAYDPSDALPPVATLFRVLVLALLAIYASGIGGQILLGIGKIRSLAIAVLCEAVLNLVLALILVRFWGLMGVAAGLLIASTVVRVFVIPRLVTRHIGISGRHWLSIVARPLAVGLTTFTLCWLIRAAYHPANWFQLAMHGVAAVSAALASIIAFGVNEEERKRFVSTPARSLIRRILGFSTAPVS